MTAARLGLGVVGPPPPDLPDADLAAFALAVGRASFALHLDEETRGALTSDQHLEVCGRAGREALRAARDERERGREACGWANAPEDVP